MTTPVIGFIGMGLMGQPMSLRLAEADFPVLVWNRSQKTLSALESVGVQVCEHLHDLVAQADILMVCVTDTQAVEEVVFAKGGVAEYGKSHQVLVDFSSIDPVATQNMAERLHQACGMSWVDAPVSGGVVGAEQGTLAIMAGGDAEQIEQLAPVFAPLSQRVTRMGPVGSGQVTKIGNQMLVSCNLLVMAEVMAMAEKAGVDSAMIPTALRGGFADSTPLQLTGPRMAERDYDSVKWHVKTLLKDLNMSQVLASVTQSDTPMAELGCKLMKEHAENGFAEHDPCTLIEKYLATKQTSNKEKL